MNILSGNSWWWQTATSRLSLEYAALAVVCAVLIALTSRALIRLNSRDPTGRGPRAVGSRLDIHDAGGSATMEFTLVFPILLFFSLLLMQVTLLAGSNAFIHYAAFAATRSAIVQIPTGYPDESPAESPNVIINADGHTKHDAIRRAAVFALVPVSGRLSNSAGNAGGSSDDFVTGLNNYYTTYSKTPPAWINNIIGDRLRYADANTTVSVMSTTVTSDGHVTFTDLPSDGSTYTFGPRDPVTVRITHRLQLAVPYVNMLFSSGTLDESQGTGRYSLVTAQSTLTNEGIYDDLPPQPDVPRAP